MWLYAHIVTTFGVESSVIKENNLSLQCYFAYLFLSFLYECIKTVSQTARPWRFLLSSSPQNLLLAINSVMTCTLQQGGIQLKICQGKTSMFYLVSTSFPACLHLAALSGTVLLWSRAENTTH